MSNMPIVTLHDSLIVSPSEPEGGMPWLDDREYAVLRYRMRCAHGCTGRMRQAVPRALLADRQAWAGYVDGLPFHAEQAHVCLRKADR